MTARHTAHSGLVVSAWAIAAIVALALAFSFVPASRAYADETLVSGHPLLAQTTKKADAKKGKTEKTGEKSGNCDKYIGLDKWKMVFAVGKTNVAIFKKNSTKSRRIAWYQRKSCIVVDTKGMKAGKDYQWLKVKLKGKARGYIKMSQVRLVVIDTKTFGLDISDKKNKRRVKICRFGLRFLGKPYGEHSGSIKKKTDCGGFARTCYRSGGGYKNIKSGNLGRLKDKGKKTTRKKLKPGDMVFYPSNGRYFGHAAIYIGKGLIMNSSGAFGHYYPRGGIRVSLLDYRSPTCHSFRNVVGN